MCAHTHRPPSCSISFGNGFADHLRHRSFVSENGWIADVAILERAWLDSYHAADAAPLAPEALGAIPEERLGDVVFRRHPASRLIACSTPAVSALVALKTGADLAATVGGDAETALITRPALTVDIRSVEGAGAVFFDALLQETPLGEAAGEASGTGPFDLGAALGAVLESGAFTSIDLDQAT